MENKELKNYLYYINNTSQKDIVKHIKTYINNDNEMISFLARRITNINSIDKQILFYILILKNNNYNEIITTATTSKKALKLVIKLSLEEKLFTIYNDAYNLLIEINKFLDKASNNYIFVSQIKIINDKKIIHKLSEQTSFLIANLKKESNKNKGN